MARASFLKVPLSLQVGVGVLLGTLLGLTYGRSPYLFGYGNQELGELGLLVIRLLKALAVPLVLFAILDAFLKTSMTGRHALRLGLICFINVSVAFGIALTLMNTLRPGEGTTLGWEGMGGVAQGTVPSSGKATLDPLKNLTGYIPETLVDPFSKNSVISVVLLALLSGAALRHVKHRQQLENRTAYQTLERGIEAIYEVLMQMLHWVVRAVPFAVFACVAQVVGRTGLSAFSALGSFVGIIVLGMALHALGYYPLMAWLVGRRTPREYVSGGADAILTGFSTNSSLASVPVTLRCLTEKLRVSPESARLAACVGTNLNNDGITLYEAMAALFLTQAAGMTLGVSEQVVLVLASLMAGIGVAGIPEAGLVVLPLVLSAAGLPEAMVAAALPLILPVDWVLARCRSAVNVMSDLLVAILLERGRQADEAKLPSPEAIVQPE